LPLVFFTTHIFRKEEGMAGALVGGAFLSAFLQVAFDRLASPEVVNYLKGNKPVDQLLRKLKMELISAHAVLNDAEEKQFTNPYVKEWLDELKHATYDADDILDKIAYEALRCKLEAESQTGTSKVCPFPTSELEEMLERLKDITKNINVLGLKEVAGGGGVALPSSRLTTSCQEKRVYGRDIDKQAIFELWQSPGASSDGICVVPIVGMGGTGKTTFAQFLYNDSIVSESFHLKAWVCVSENFDIFKIFKTIIEEVTLSPPKTENLSLMQTEIKEALKENKFFLVLDDVWNENYNAWAELVKVFECGAQEVKIIVTTRSERVASNVRTVPTHYCLTKLSNDDCWDLFTQHAFVNRNPNEFPDLVKTGKEIVKKCGCLPLAVKTIGGSLRSNLSLPYWNKILNSHIWDLPITKSYILPALRLSYHYLPSHLKPCFAYCSIFPNDCEFDKNKLILLWMAEGLLQKPKENGSVEFEEIGEEYFNDLVSASFFQQSNKSESRFLMHDFISDLAKSISREFCFRPENDKSNEITIKTRHFSYYKAKHDAFMKFKIPYEAKGLRTFLGGSCLLYRLHEYDNLGKMIDELVQAFKCLRVLSLSNIGELPDSVGDLKHLRYLDIGDTKIKHLPDSLCSLYNLQVLILPRCITKLPTHMCKLINLRHLDNTSPKLEEMPPQMGKLKNLRKLSVFVVNKNGGSNTGELGELQQLSEKLSILNLENVHCIKDATEVMLKDKQDLSELELKWKDDHDDDSEKERNVLEQLWPPKNLKSLTIVNYAGTKFPNWLGDPSFQYMVSIVLKGCKNCFFLPPLGQLPCLKKLKIKGFKGEKVGPEFYENDSSVIEPRFRSLEYLSFVDMQEWQEWVIFDGEVFPCLQELYIYDCPKLSRGLPNELPSLTKLEIKNCRQLVASLPTSCHYYPSLESIYINGDGHHSLWSFPLELFSKLKSISMWNCENLNSFSASGCHPNLTSLTIHNCPNFVSFFSGEKLKSLPEGMHALLPALVTLRLEQCPELESFPEEGLPSNLEKLEIFDCDKLFSRCREWRWHSLTKLREFIVGSDCEESGNFPEEAWLPSTLAHFEIIYSRKWKSLSSRKWKSLS
jgi:hypothetical protein